MATVLPNGVRKVEVVAKQGIATLKVKYVHAAMLEEIEVYVLMRHLHDDFICCSCSYLCI